MIAFYFTEEFPYEQIPPYSNTYVNWNEININSNIKFLRCSVPKIPNNINLEELGIPI